MNCENYAKIPSGCTRSGEVQSQPSELAQVNQWTPVDLDLDRAVLRVDWPTSSGGPGPCDRVDRTTYGPGPLVDLALCVDGLCARLSGPPGPCKWTRGSVGLGATLGLLSAIPVQRPASLPAPGPLV